jgi:paraquat-inducible protein B
MTQAEQLKPNPDALPDAVIAEPRKGLSMVWFIPLVALAIGAWLVFKAITEKGPTITITFETAAGLEAGKTKIKYKDVVVGQVENLLNENSRKSRCELAEQTRHRQRYASNSTTLKYIRFSDSLIDSSKAISQ